MDASGYIFELQLDEVDQVSGGLSLPTWVAVADAAADFLKGLKEGIEAGSRP
jgi:hypothetical protein